LGADKAKDEETIKNGTAVLQEMLASTAVPASLLAKSDCVIVLPKVKKFGIGVGGSGGRGAMSCRLGKNFDGKWSAPAIFTVSGVSAGLQIGGSSSDYVLLVMTQKGVDTILKGKTKVGNDASAAAGPSGAMAGQPVGTDLVTYGRTKGLFAGVSLGGATLDADSEANKRLYDKPTWVTDIVLKDEVKITPAGEDLIALLTSKAGKRSK
jgi:lipid-binding SYLF domain-containing protein